jgi:hypothetical protein
MNADLVVIPGGMSTITHSSEEAFQASYETSVLRLFLGRGSCSGTSQDSKEVHWI